MRETMWVITFQDNLTNRFFYCPGVFDTRESAQKAVEKAAGCALIWVVQSNQVICDTALPGINWLQIEACELNELDEILKANIEAGLQKDERNSGDPFSDDFWDDLLGSQ